MNDILELRATFLEVVGVKTKEDAMRESINSAVATRGGGKFYATADTRERTALKEEWGKLICDEAERYFREETLGEQTLDDEHCEAIGRIAEKLSSKFKQFLWNGKLRYGSSQKAFNLYLKNLFYLGKFALPPPHCPVDGIVLDKARINGKWTRCETKDEYMDWIGKVRAAAQRESLHLTDWENKVWLEERKKGQHSSGQCQGSPTES